MRLKLDIVAPHKGRYGTAYNVIAIERRWYKMARAVRLRGHGTEVWHYTDKRPATLEEWAFFNAAVADYEMFGGPSL